MSRGSCSHSASQWRGRFSALFFIMLLATSCFAIPWAQAQEPAGEQQSTAIESEEENAGATAKGLPRAQVAPVPEAVETTSFGVRDMFQQADPLVKGVMLLLVFCSLLTWAVLLEKSVVFSRARRGNLAFLKAFRNGEMDTLQALASKSAMGRMWQVGQSELKHYEGLTLPAGETDRINRLLQRMALTASIVQERDLSRMGSMMGVLATIGATAPFIGLFGTVWGILNSFASIAALKTASLVVVAPGIAEALLATALGLFAAIPAVMIFNKFAREINGFVGTLDNFSAEMIASVSRQLDEGR